MSELTRDGHQGRPGPDLQWTKSSFSFANSNCVEVANLPGGHIGVRDSKDTTGPVLRFTPGEWRDFIGGVRNGQYDGIANLWLLSGRPSCAGSLSLGTAQSLGRRLARR